MVSAIDVAAYILELVGGVTTMKLQKLVYYAQARYIVVCKSPLFSDRIEAWANGPVVPDLFRAHSGKYMIGKGDLETLGSPLKLSISQRSAVERVIELFGSYSGEQLRELTHQENPWASARKGCKPGERCANEITVDAMRDFYSSSSCENPVAK